MQFSFVTVAIAALVASASAQNMTYTPVNGTNSTVAPIPTPSAPTAAGNANVVSFFGLSAALAAGIAMAL